MEDILHIDMDAFYASVEQRDHPEYKGKPLVVSGDVGSRSVISTASYEARKYNIFSAMPLAAALKKCPDIIIINPDFKKYASASDHIKTILHEYSPEIEQASIDEFYLNISGSHLLFGSSFEIAKKIQSHIKKELQLTCSIGISYNKLLAKMASNIKKPEGITHITGSNLSALFDHLEIEKIPGLGKKAALKLHMINVFTIKELKKLSLKKLNELFGINGTYFYNASRGIGSSELIFSNDVKSISNEITLKYDTMDQNIIKKIMLKLSDQVASRLRMDKLKGKTIKIKLRYYDFKTISKQLTLVEFINTADDLYRIGLDLIDDMISRPIRLIGVGVSSLIHENNEQLSLFKNNKKLEFEKNIDVINKKFGSKTIKRGSLL